MTITSEEHFAFLRSRRRAAQPVPPAIASAPGELSRASRGLPRLALHGAAYVLVSAGIGINGYFAFGLGRTLLASAGFAAISVACSIGAFYIPSACRLRPAVAAAWLALFGLGLFEAYGFVASNITDTAADHVNAEVALAERRADTLSASREAECRKRGPLCRDLEAAERAALAALATARERNGNPHVTAIARLTGLAPDAIGLAWQTLLAVVSQLGFVLLWLAK